MSARKEFDEIKKQKELATLKEYPNILTRYFLEGSASQMVSKIIFSRQMRRFCDYLRENGTNVENEAIWGTITKRNLKDYLQNNMTHTLKDGTIKTVKTQTLKEQGIALNSFFQYLIEEEIISGPNPVPSAREIEKFSPKEVEDHKVTAMTLQEFSKVKKEIETKSNMPKRDTCIFVLGCSYGLRATALGSIDVSDIDFEKKVLVVWEKNNYKRTIYLDDYAIQVIKECIEEKGEIEGCDALFTRTYQHKKDRLAVTGIAKIVLKYTSCIEGKRITPHKMRSTCVTITYEQTHNIYAASVKAGHSDVKVTQRYIDTTNEQKKVNAQVGSLFANC